LHHIKIAAARLRRINLKFAYTLLFLSFVPSLLAQSTTISMNPSTPAPHEPFTFTVHSTWPTGCVPRFQSVTAVGSTILINTSSTDCNQACTTVITPYNLVTPAIAIQNGGVYIVEYHVTDCKQNDSIVASQQFVISPLCPFDRALHASATAARVGEQVLLH